MAGALQVLTAWDLQPLPTAGALAAAVWYLLAVRRFRAARGPKSWSSARTGSFLAGVGLAWFVVVGPLGALDDTYFVAHMIQHLVLMMVAPPLIILGAPVLLLLATLDPPSRRRWVVPALRSRAAAFLTNPVVTWALFAGVLLGTHFTPFYDYAITHRVIHTFVEHPLYLSSGLLYFYPLLGAHGLPNSPPAGLKVLSLLLMMVPETMTGFFLYSSRYVIYPSYAVATRILPMSALADQQLGGALMWSSAMIVDVAWISVAVSSWLRSEGRKAIRIDRESAALAIVPDPGRAP
jgi:putative copper resistance protein D